MRAVLRKLREQILSAADMELLAKSRLASDQVLRERSLDFFAAHVLRITDSSADIVSGEEAFDLMSFFLCLDRFQSENEGRNRPGRDAQKHVTFKNFSTKIFEPVQGNQFMGIFVDYLRRNHLDKMLEKFKPELQDCRRKSFEAIVRLLLV